MKTELGSKVIIVTGGAKGIGLATARLFAEQNAKIVIVDKDTMAGQVAQKELQEQGAEVLFIATDLSKTNVCKDVTEQVVKKFGQVDVLVNNAGVNDHIGLNSTTEEFVDSLRLNLVHYFEMVKFAIPYLRETQGKIINVGSKVATTGQGGTSGYAAAKGAVLALTREWALEFANDNVTVNAVIPAEVDTPMYRQELNKNSDPVAAKRHIEALIPLSNRLTMPEEIANTVVFLGSSLANHITGQHIFVDGGYTHLNKAQISK